MLISKVCWEKVCYSWNEYSRNTHNLECKHWGTVPLKCLSPRATTVSYIYLNHELSDVTWCLLKLIRQVVFSPLPWIAINNHQMLTDMMGRPPGQGSGCKLLIAAPTRVEWAAQQYWALFVSNLQLCLHPDRARQTTHLPPGSEQGYHIPHLPWAAPCNVWMLSPCSEQ